MSKVRETLDKGLAIVVATLREMADGLETLRVKLPETPDSQLEPALLAVMEDIAQLPLRLDKALSNIPLEDA